MTVASFEQLPRTLPIFPLAGVLLLPGGKLPLNIFEPRYLAMTRDAMGGHRIIGMLQPLNPANRQAKPEIYQIGCAGRITSFKETDDGRFLINLTGLCRFNIVEELTVTTPYRQVLASYARYRSDLQENDPEAVDRDRLLPALRAYLAQRQIPADWRAIEKAPNDALINSLAMICPFAASEKQALLEASDIGERARVMTALIEMALLQQAGGGAEPRLQ